MRNANTVINFEHLRNIHTMDNIQEEYPKMKVVCLTCGYVYSRKLKEFSLQCPRCKYRFVDTFKVKNIELQKNGEHDYLITAIEYFDGKKHSKIFI